MHPCESLLLVAALVLTQPDERNFAHDFRGGGPLPDTLKLVGPDVDATVKVEDAGLRFTLPDNRKPNQQVGVRLKRRLVGDFTLTGAYEVIKAEKPSKGIGVGVALNIAVDETYNKFAKVGQFFRPTDGNVFLAEYWHKDPAKDYKIKPVPTDAQVGQVRLVRQGTMMHYLAAKGLGDDFQEIFQFEFGAEDVIVVRFGVNTNASPTGIDARLLDLKVRSDGLLPTRGAPGAPAAPAPAPPRSPFALWGAVAAGIIVLVAGALFAGRALLRRRQALPVPGQASETHGETLDVACPECRKRLKVSARHR